MGFRVGIYDHLGWAVAVTATIDHHVVDRRRIALNEPGVPCMPIHHPEPGLSVEEIAVVVERVRAAAMRATTASFDALASSLSEAVESVHLRETPEDFPTEIAVQLRRPHEARADAIMYRQVIASVAGARGWRVEAYDAKTVETGAAGMLGDRADSVLRGPRARLGPPWTQEHRVALAATMLWK